jgi:hypothetical protein
MFVAFVYGEPFTYNYNIPYMVVMTYFDRKISEKPEVFNSML